MRFDRRLLWVLLPYTAVLIGMLFHSAWGALLGFHAALLIVLLRPKVRMHATRLLIPVSMRAILPMAIMGVFGGLGLWFVWPFAGLSTVSYIEKVTSLGLSGEGWIPFIAYFSLVNPWLEEWFWRGYLMDSAQYPVLVDAVFAGYHLFILMLFVSAGWMLFAFVVLLITGWVWRRVSLRVNGLLPAVLSHMLADFSILVILYMKTGA